MRIKSKTNFLLKIALCIALAFSTVGAVWSFIGGNTFTAKAETEYANYFGLEDRSSWASGGHADIVTFGLMDFSVTEGNQYFKSSVSGCWFNGNNDVIAANYGKDILQYIYINGECARDLITANASVGNVTANTGFWLANSAAWPIAFETGTDCWIRVDKTKFGGSFTFTIKAGFSLIRSDGVVCTTSEDIDYSYTNGALSKIQKYTVTFNNEGGTTVSTKKIITGQAIGELPEVPEKTGCGGFWTINGKAIDENTIINSNQTVTPVYGIEYEDLLGLEDRTSWGADAGEYYFGGVTLSPFGYFNTAASVNATWHADTTAPITANAGIDIMKYIYVNGECARDLIVANYKGAQNKNSCGCWLSNPAAWPVYVETTTGSGIMIRLAKAYFGDTITFTFKKGFSLVKSDGQRIYVSSDITYTYENGTLGGRTVDKKYTLSFDGTDETKELSNGATIGNLPEIPAKDGCTSAWTIDGVEITADTVYNYGANKTAKILYSKDITETIGLGDWGVPETEPDIRYLWIRNNGAEIATAYPYSYWNDHVENKNSNFGVDVMEYVLIDGETVRSIITENATNGTYKASKTEPLSWGGCFAPITIETAGDGIRFKIMVEYKTSFKLTFKAGFTIVNTDGVKLYTTSDVVYNVGETMGNISKVATYTLTFDGVETREIDGGTAIGNLPEIPAKDGCTGVWTIDGVEITADTVYNYGVNKTAKILYSKDITETIGLGDWGVPETESDIRYLLIRDNNAEIATAYPYEYWNDHADNKNSNYGVDLLEYILIDGETVRSIIKANETSQTYKAESTFPLSEGGIYAPIALSTLGDGARFKVMVDYKTAFELTFKAGFTIVNTDGVKLYTTSDVVYNVGETMGSISKVKECTLSFDGLGDTITVINGQPIGELPAVPEKDGSEGYWTIDGVEIDENTVYNYGVDKKAVAGYRKDISKYIALEDRTSWGACAQGGEFYFGVLDMSTISKDANGNDVNYLSSNNAGCWYHGNNAPIEANNGIDIMQYIYVNDKSARELITANATSEKPHVNGCACWLNNSVASPVYVETSANAGIMIRVLQSFVGNYFEITLKSGFSLVNTDGVRVYLTKDVTYKYIVTNEGTTFAKGELTDAELDALGGQKVTMMNGNEEYLVKTTCLLTLPEIAPVIVGEGGLSKVLVGWTTDPTNLSNLYPVGYKLKISEEMTLHAVWMGFELQEGAAVRLTAGSSGIRFLTDIDAGAYKIGVEKGLITGVGTFLVPTDYLELGMDFVHGSFGKDYYMDKVTETWKVNGESDTTWTYVAAFVNISESQYSRRFSARGYLKIKFSTGEGYVYTPYLEENNARSIYDVAVAAYNDEENPAYKTHATILNYVNKVANLTWDNTDYSFVKTANVPGNYTIGDITVDGNVVTVKVDGDVSSAVVNGKRLAAVKNQSSNVVFGDLIFSISGFELVEGGFTFKLGASNKAAKDSEDTLYFDSSSEDLDFFLNDFFKRHSGLVVDSERPKVNSVVAGATSEEFFSHEWMSTSYYWFNSFEGFTNEKGDIEDRIKGLRKFLSTVPVDDYGYVWSSNDRVRDAYTEVKTGEQKMGWPFPNNDTVNTKHWEFNSSSESWSSNISASASGGLYGKNLSNQSSNITFTSNSFSSWSTGKINTFYAPLLEFEVRIDDATNIEDIYVWYSTSSSTSFSEDKKLSVKDKAFLNYGLGNTSGAYNHILYLPMYAESAWGESTSTYLKQLKIEIALKSGKTISGNVALNYVRPTLDTRMSNNNSILISSLRTDYEYTGDLEYLTENITRARKAMNFLMQMYDSTRGLKKESYLVGHGGTKESLNLLGNATNKSIASSISQGYWDIMYMPEYDFQSNTYFYKALRDLAYLEEVLDENGITVDEDATVKTATRNRTTGTSAYSYDLSATADTVLANLRQTTENTNHTGFWNATNGRFVAGYASGENKWYDYGYVAWNLEAIYYGIATEEQATAIMNWLNSEGNLYKYGFAPLSITVTGDADALNGEYAAQKDSWINCQFGGAILYTSYYDLMARIDTLGADNAFGRLTAIQNWYKEVYDYYVANGTDPYDFYRYYYDNEGIQCQGMGTAGAVGLDREFLESFLPLSAVANGFFGIEGRGTNLEVAPELPADLDFWKMENLAFNFVKYDLTIFENAIQLNNVRGEVEGLTITIALDYTDGQSVYVNGAKVTDYSVKDGKAYVTVDFGATIVEVR